MPVEVGLKEENVRMSECQNASGRMGLKEENVRMSECQWKNLWLKEENVRMSVEEWG